MRRAGWFLSSATHRWALGTEPQRRGWVTLGHQGLGFPCSSPLSSLVPRKGSVVSFILNLKALRERSELSRGSESKIRI